MRLAWWLLPANPDCLPALKTDRSSSLCALGTVTVTLARNSKHASQSCRSQKAETTLVIAHLPASICNLRCKFKDSLGGIHNKFQASLGNMARLGLEDEKYREE